jgi:RimJ/RimL family protein N-acetyltransferase
VDDSHLMRLHLETLFIFGDNGRLVSNNASPRGPAPKFFIGRTPHGNVWAFRNDLAEQTIQQLAALAARESALLESAPADSEAYVETLQASDPITRIWAGPTFCFPDASHAASGTVLISAENAHLLAPFQEEWSDEGGTGPPIVADLVDGRAVSICRSVRVTSRSHEAGVTTLPEFRNRGHGARVVAAWAAAIRSQKRIPLYSTAWENHASRGLARRLGLRQYGSTFHVT